MEEPFKPQSLTINELYGNKDSFYKIPQYQRPYKWEDDEVNKLWDDIKDAWESAEPNYFLGSVITAKPRDNDNTAYVDIVDGQQRLTTLMILFCVIRDLYPNINSSDNSIHAVNIETINSAIKQYNKADRLKLNTHRQHQSDFEELIITEGSTKNIKKPNKKQTSIDEEPKYKFINTAFILNDNLKSLGESVAADFLNYLFNQVIIIRIDCKNRDFAIKMFQVLNDRGMDLTAADLFKSFLLDKLHTKYRPQNDLATIKEEQFMSDWREMEQNMKNLDINLDDLLTIYGYYTLANKPKTALHEVLQDNIRDEDPNLIISDLKKFASTYKIEVHDTTNKIMYSLWYLRWSVYWKVIVLTAKHTSYADYEKLLYLIRRFYYLYWIAGKSLSHVKHTSFNIVKMIKDKSKIEDIADEIDKKIKSDKIEELVINNLDDQHIAQMPWCKPLLTILEYNSTDRENHEYIYLNDGYIHVEHILPQKYHSISQWNHFDKRVGDQVLHSLGNITLLSGTKNIEASNNPFDIKISVYEGKGKYKDKDGKITSFQITQKIVNEFKNKSYNESWNLESVKDRRNWALEEIEKIFDIDCTQLKTKFSFQ